MSGDAAADRIAALRARFPGAQRLTYLDVAARALLSLDARREVEGYLEGRMYEGADKAALLRRIETTRARFAALIRAEPDEIAFTKNVSDGINAFAAALPWREGDNVVLCESLEHPANVFPWQGLRRTRGVGLKIVPPENAQIPLDRILDAIDSRTRVVTVSSVSFSPGFRFPLAELGAACRARGVLLLVDGAQSVGVLDTDVNALQLDALATSTQKGLLGLYGMGFLYVRRAVAEQLHPAYLSRMGVDLGTGHEAASGDPAAYRLAPAARRFDVGNFNYAAALAVERSIEDLLAIGSMAVEAHACGLAADLARRLLDCGLPVFGGANETARAHIVAVGDALSAEHDSTSDAAMLDLHAFLTEAGVRHTIRRGVLRFSFHVYNDASDVEQVVELAQAWVARRGTRAA